MLLTELFDTPIKLDWHKMGAYYFATCEIQDHYFEMPFGLIDPENDVWLTNFSVDGNVTITNDGIAKQVFAAATKAIINWSAKVNPKWIIFTASTDEPSRIRLYRRMRTRLSGWHDLSTQSEIWPQEAKDHVNAAEELTVLVRDDIYRNISKTTNSS